MCNVAGYSGTKQAAPILIEMLRKEEGIDSGYYTGIATMHEGKIYTAKVVGDLQCLLEQTDAASLPGTVGIIHSRTPGDAGWTWSHPFTCEREGEIQTAFLCNGTVGCYKPQEPGYIAIAEGLIADGYEMKSAIPTNGKKWTLTDNSTRVHLTDVMCQLISRRIDRGADTVTALEESYCEMPIENIGLLLSKSLPDTISWVRLNFPLFRGTSDHGTYLATTPLVFPEDAYEPHLMPTMSAGTLTKDTFTCKRFDAPPAKVAPITPQIRSAAYTAVCEVLSEGHKTYGDACRAVKPMFAPADCLQTGAVVYDILYDLSRQGRLKMEREYLPGVFEGMKAPKIYMSLTEQK